MADDTQQIKISSILPSLSQDDQMAIARGSLEEVSHVIYSYAENHGISSATADHLVDEALHSYTVPPEEFVARQQQEKTTSNASSLDDAVGALAGVATLGMRSPKEDEIALNFNEKYKAQLTEKLKAIEGMQDPAEKQKALKELLNEVKSSTLAKQRIDDLAQRLGEGKDENGNLKETKASQRVRKRFVDQQAQKEKDKKKETTDAAFEKYNDRLAKRLFTEFETPEAREAYIMKMAQHQLARTHEDFTGLFYEKKKAFGLFGPQIRRRAISLRAQGKVARSQQKELKPIYKAQEKQRKEAERKKRAEENKNRSRFQQLFERIQFFQPVSYTEDVETWARTEYPNEYSNYMGGGSGGGGFDPLDMANRAYDMYDRARRFNNFLKMLRGAGAGAEAGGAGGAAGGAGAAAAAGTSEFWVPALAILFLIIIFIVLIVLLFQASQNVTVQMEQEQCGDFSQVIDVTDFSDKYADIQWDVFHIHNPGGNYQTTDGSHPNPHYQDAMNAYSFLFNTLCVLYGHAQGKLTGDNNFNTFAKLLLGDRFYQKNGRWIFVDDQHEMGTGKEKAKILTTFISFDDSIPYCFVEFQPHPPNDHYITSIFYNPQLCTTAEFQFLIAQSLTHAMIVQQVDIMKKDDVYNLFKTQPSSTGIIGEDGNLPTFGCNGSGDDLVFGSFDGKVHKDPPLGELQSDQQQRDCFADMVGEYLSYPFYTDTTRGMNGAAPPPTGPVTPTPKPTSKPVSLADYPSGKYADYYNFAKTNLFDGESFFFTTQAAQCPDHIADSKDESVITAGLKKFGFLVTGKTTLDKLSQTYATVCLLMQSERYKSLIKTDKTPVTINFSDAQPCCGYTTGDTINIYGWKDTDFNRFTLVHELTHELVHDNRSPDVYTKYDNNVYHNSPKLPSYNCQHDYDNDYCTIDGEVCGPQRSGLCKQKCSGPYEGECIADAIGLYMVYPKFNDVFSGPDAGKPMTDYPSGKYSTYYQFAYDEVFGGTVFNGGNPSTGGEFASSLVDRFKADKYCFHDSRGRGWAFLNAQDEYCIERVNPPLPLTKPSAAEELKLSISEFPGGLQCVGFARAVAAAIGKPFSHRGDARTYYYNTPQGYQQIPRKGNEINIQAGDVVIYDYPGGQHIADVSKIISTEKGDDGNMHTIFQVSEGNGGYCRNTDGTRADGCLDTANETTQNSDIVGWIRPL